MRRRSTTPEMQRIAAEVDYAETAFVTGEVRRRAHRALLLADRRGAVLRPRDGGAAIAIAEREGPGTLRFATPVGEIVIETTADRDGIRAAFTSVDTDLAHFPEFVLDALLELLDVDRTQLDERYPPRLAFAGNWHPVIVITDAAVFDGFAFDPGAVRAFMDAQGWPATITVLHRIDGCRGWRPCGSRRATSSPWDASPRTPRPDRRRRRSADTSAVSARCTRPPAC